MTHPQEEAQPDTSAVERVDVEQLRTALEFHDQGFTPWTEEKELFIAAARVYLTTLTQPDTVQQPAMDAVEAAQRYSQFFNKLWGAYCRAEISDLDDAYLICRLALEAGLIREEVYKAELHAELVADSSVFEDGDPVFFPVPQAALAHPAQRQVDKCPDCGAAMIEVCSGLEKLSRGDDAGMCSWGDYHPVASKQEDA